MEGVRQKEQSFTRSVDSLEIIGTENGIAFLFFFNNSFTLEYYRFFFVMLKISSGLPDPVFQKKQKTFPSTAVYHKNYTANISLTEKFVH